MLSAEKRNRMGTGNSRLLIEQGYYPAVIYGEGVETVHVKIKQSLADTALKSAAVRTHPFNIDVEGKSYHVLVKDIQLKPVKNVVRHIDFLIVSEKKEVNVDLPVVLLNDDVCLGVKEGGIIDHAIRSIPIKALPKNMPDALEVDLAELNVGDSIHLSEVVMPIGVSLQKEIDDEHNPMIVSVSAPRVVEEVEEPVEDQSDGVDEVTDSAEDKASSETESEPEDGKA